MPPAKKQDILSSDEQFMQVALRLGRIAMGTTAPNPAVGCVIAKNGCVIGQGYTQAGGRPHAEVMALHMAGSAAKGAIAYVTLEPCSHTGHTGPCAEALIQAGIARVVIAMQDPDPRVHGNGIRMLQQADTEVITGVGAEQAQQDHAGFVLRITQKRPYITLKLATSKNGVTAPGKNYGQWITGWHARMHGHLLRAQHDAILVGINTVIHDDPSLTCRLPGCEQHSPIRVILDRNGLLPATSTLVTTAQHIPVWHCTQTGVSLPHVEHIPVNPHDITEVLARLAQRGITRLLVEGGATVAHSFLRANAVDALAWYQAPHIIDGAALVFSMEEFEKSPKWKLTDTKTLSEDTLRLYVNTNNKTGYSE